MTASSFWLERAVLGCVSDTPTLHSSSFQEIAFLLLSKISEEDS
jgi:hypothetical protein